MPWQSKGGIGGQSSVDAPVKKLGRFLTSKVRLPASFPLRFIIQCSFHLEVDGRPRLSTSHTWVSSKTSSPCRPGVRNWLDCASGNMSRAPSAPCIPGIADAHELRCLLHDMGQLSRTPHIVRTDPGHCRLCRRGRLVTSSRKMGTIAWSIRNPKQARQPS